MFLYIRENRVQGVNMGPIWGRQDLGGPHAGPMNFVIWAIILFRALVVSALGRVMQFICPYTLGLLVWHWGNHINKTEHKKFQPLV